MTWFRDFRYNFISLAFLTALMAIASGLYAEGLATRIGIGIKFAILLPHLLADGCIIFLAAELVERTLLRNFDRAATERNEELSNAANKRNEELNNAANNRHESLGATLSEKVETVLRLSLDDAKYAAKYQVHFRPPRRSESNAEVSYNEIAKAIESAEWIKLLCTSGRDLFSNELTVINGLKRRAAKAPLTITVLSCEPTSEDGARGMYARVRGELEEPRLPNIVSDDVHVALDDFKKLFILSNCSESIFRWYYYDFVPQGWFFLTDKVGFAEFYHFGLDIRARGISSSCMGGRVPLVSFSPSAGLYGAVNEFLSYLAGSLFLDNAVAQRHRKEFFKINTAYDSTTPLSPDKGRCPA